MEVVRDASYSLVVFLWYIRFVTSRLSLMIARKGSGRFGNRVVPSDNYDKCLFLRMIR